MRKARTITTVAVVLGLLISARSPAREPEAASPVTAKPDGQRILGTWILQSGNRKNNKDEESSDGDAEGGTRVLLTFEADNRWTAVVDSQGAKQEIGGSYYLDPEQTPKLFDINLVAGTYQLSVFAIYEFAGDDQLRLRFHLDGKQRPADFEAPVEGASLYTFVRQAMP